MQVTHNDGSGHELLKESLKHNTYGLHERLHFNEVWKGQVSYQRISNDVPSGFTYFSQQSQNQILLNVKFHFTSSLEALSAMTDRLNHIHYPNSPSGRPIERSLRDSEAHPSRGHQCITIHFIGRIPICERIRRYWGAILTYRFLLGQITFVFINSLEIYFKNRMACNPTKNPSLECRFSQ